MTEEMKTINFYQEQLSYYKNRAIDAESDLKKAVHLLKVARDVIHDNHCFPSVHSPYCKMLSGFLEEKKAL
jgi:hypothetical protein